MTEDEMVGWYHRLNGHEFEQSLGDDKGQESWHTAIHGVTKGGTQLRDRTTTTKIAHHSPSTPGGRYYSLHYSDEKSETWSSVKGGSGIQNQYAGDNRKSAKWSIHKHMCTHANYDH